jgi:hypothetical protein
MSEICGLHARYLGQEYRHPLIISNTEDLLQTPAGWCSKEILREVFGPNRNKMWNGE